jgi:hypothetical protein
MSEKPTFAERVERMRAAADELRTVLEFVEAEAAAMAAVQSRFEAKKPKARAITS